MEKKPENKAVSEQPPKRVKWIHQIMMISTSIVLFGCIHPKVGIRKTRLLDPTMDPGRGGDFGEVMMASPQGQYERAISAGGAVSGGACPTCK